MTQSTTRHGQTALSGSESEVVRQLRSPRFGQVSVQVHDARIVQIERTERIRTDHRADETTKT